MLAFFQSGSGFAALLAFAASWAVLVASVALLGFARRAAQALLRVWLAQRSIRRLRAASRLPSGRSQGFIPPRLCRAAHWGYQFPLLWAARSRFVRWQASRRFAALQAVRG